MHLPRANYQAMSMFYGSGIPLSLAHNSVAMSLPRSLPGDNAWDDAARDNDTPSVREGRHWPPVAGAAGE
jgi:hypothetical protein